MVICISRLSELLLCLRLVFPLPFNYCHRSLSIVYALLLFWLSAFWETKICTFELILSVLISAFNLIRLLNLCVYWGIGRSSILNSRSVRPWSHWTMTRLRSKMPGSFSVIWPSRSKPSLMLSGQELISLEVQTNSYAFFTDYFGLGTAWFDKKLSLFFIVLFLLWIAKDLACCN